jgi:hypothetical protein
MSFFRVHDHNCALIRLILIYVSSRAAQQEHTTMTRSAFVVAADITLVVVPIRMNMHEQSQLANDEPFLFIDSGPIPSLAIQYCFL